MDNELAQINQKLEYLTAQFEAQREQQQSMKELVDDAVPIVNHVVKLSIDELAEIGNDFELGDLLFLVKRVLRDTRMLVGLLDQLEAVAELANEGQHMGKRIFHQVTMELDRLEREGYFGFARAGAKVAERLVHDHKPEDLEALGTRLADTLQEETPEKVSLFALLRAMGDQKVRRGLYRSLNLLKAIGD
ncbi:MAG TPA: DUF1641 domain-containing protein [Anaerolineales bacterium]|nr:DUF1641 domain-containing protein [Anaerolineales bacterium]